MEERQKMVKIKHLCRICFSYPGTIDVLRYPNGTGWPLQKRILSCLDIYIVNKPGFPTLICSDCCKFINTWTAFKMRADQLQRPFRYFYSNQSKDDRMFFKTMHNPQSILTDHQQLLSKLELDLRQYQDSRKNLRPLVNGNSIEDDEVPELGSSENFINTETISHVSVPDVSNYMADGIRIKEEILSEDENDSNNQTLDIVDESAMDSSHVDPNITAQFQHSVFDADDDYVNDNESYSHISENLPNDENMENEDSNSLDPQFAYVKSNTSVVKRSSYIKRVAMNIGNPLIDNIIYIGSKGDFFTCDICRQKYNLKNLPNHVNTLVHRKFVDITLNKEKLTKEVKKQWIKKLSGSTNISREEERTRLDALYPNFPYMTLADLKQMVNSIIYPETNDVVQVKEYDFSDDPYYKDSAKCTLCSYVFKSKMDKDRHFMSSKHKLKLEIEQNGGQLPEPEISPNEDDKFCPFRCTKHAFTDEAFAEHMIVTHKFTQAQCLSLLDIDDSRSTRSSNKPVINVENDNIEDTCEHENMKSKKYNCVFCGLVLNNNTGLSNHLRACKKRNSENSEIKNKEKSFFCSDCNLHLNKENFHQHRSTYHGAINCRICKKTFENYVKLRNHLRKHYNLLPSQYICVKCYKIFNDRVALNEHKKSCKVKSQVFECHSCSASFDSIELLTKHRNTEHLDNDSNIDMSDNADSDTESPSAKVESVLKEEDGNNESGENSTDLTKEPKVFCHVCKRFYCKKYFQDHKKRHKDRKYMERMKMKLYRSKLSNNVNLMRRLMRMNPALPAPAKIKIDADDGEDDEFDDDDDEAVIVENTSVPMPKSSAQKRTPTPQSGGSGTAYCKICKIFYSNIANLTRHMKLHKQTEPENRMSICKSCGESFPNMVLLRVHKRQSCPGSNDSETEQFSTSIEKADSPPPPILIPETTLNLEPDISDNDTSKIHSCLQCNKKFSSKKSLYTHFSTVVDCFKWVKRKCAQCGKFNKQTNKICDFCQGKRFRLVQINRRKKHLNDGSGIQKKKEQKIYRCMFGNKMFLTKKQMLSHSDTCDGSCLNQRFISCRKCKQRFKSLKLYADHKLNCGKHVISLVRQPTNKLKFKFPIPKKKTSFACQYCNKQFQRHGTCLEHEMQCPKNQKNQSSSNGDVQQEIFFPCLYCGRKFQNEAELRIHEPQCNLLKIYSKDGSTKTSFTCSDCGKSYTSKGGLHGHIYAFHSNNKYRCLICRSDDILQINLFKHSYKCLKETLISSQTFACPLCNVLFDQNDTDTIIKGKLTKHLARCYKIPSCEGENSKFMCFECSFLFESKQAMIRHRQIKHGLMADDDISSEHSGGGSEKNETNNENDNVDAAMNEDVDDTVENMSRVNDEVGDEIIDDDYEMADDEIEENDLDENKKVENGDDEDSIIAESFEAGDVKKEQYDDDEFETGDESNGKLDNESNEKEKQVDYKHSNEVNDRESNNEKMECQEENELVNNEDEEIEERELPFKEIPLEISVNTESDSSGNVNNGPELNIN